MRGRGALVAALALLGPGLGASCREAGSDDPNRHPQIWSLYDVEAALADNAPLAVDPTLPGGLSPQEILVPQDDGTAVVKVTAAFAEEWAAAYMITDIWRGYQAVWAQPWYFLVTAWNETAPFTNRLKYGDGTVVPPLFDVAPSSNFYSPFWLLEFAEVPADADPTIYKDTKILFDEHRTVHLSNAFTYPLHPETVRLPRDPADATKIKLVHPLLGTTFTGWSDTPTAIADGKVYPSWNAGRDNFLYDDEFLVEEVPLFMLAKRGPDGQPESMNSPPVAGLAPLLRGQAPLPTTTAPRLKAYYRLTWAIAPANALAFDPVAYPDAAALLAGRLDAAGKPLNAQVYTGRVALNAQKAAVAPATGLVPDCFASTAFPEACQWLDSQAHVEARLGPGNLKPTAVTVSAPSIAVASPASPAP